MPRWQAAFRGIVLVPKSWESLMNRCKLSGRRPAFLLLIALLVASVLSGPALAADKPETVTLTKNQLIALFCNSVSPDAVTRMTGFNAPTVWTSNPSTDRIEILMLGGRDDTETARASVQQYLRDVVPMLTKLLKSSYGVELEQSSISIDYYYSSGSSSGSAPRKPSLRKILTWQDGKFILP